MFANVLSLNLIANAYGLGMHQVMGFPGWAETDRYVLQATMDREKFEAFKTLPLDEQLRQQRLMTQAVLADRYQLKTHHETREMPVYELVVANGGPKLREKLLEGRPGASFFMPRHWRNYGTMEDLASNLAGPTGGVVIDKTGLGTKTFIYELKWTSDSQSGVAGGDPSIFTALEEQLGLKLVPATDPVEVLVIDHIEKPTPATYRRPLRDHRSEKQSRKGSHALWGLARQCGTARFRSLVPNDRQCSPKAIFITITGTSVASDLIIRQTRVHGQSRPVSHSVRPSMCMELTVDCNRSAFSLVVESLERDNRGSLAVFRQDNSLADSRRLCRKKKEQVAQIGGVKKRH